MTEISKRITRRRHEREVDPKECAKSFCQSNTDQNGLVKQFINDYIGFGVFSTRSFSKGDFVLEYNGNLIMEKEAEILQENYKKNNSGNFLYFFEHEKKKLCIDATYSQLLGKYANDSSHGNCAMQKIVVCGVPKLVLFALSDICDGDEIRYNYGANGLWWRKEKNCKKKYNLYELTNCIQPDNNIMTLQSLFDKDNSTNKDMRNKIDKEIKSLEAQIVINESVNTETADDFHYNSMAELVKHHMRNAADITPEEYVELHEQFAVNQTTDPVLKVMRERLSSNMPKCVNVEEVIKESFLLSKLPSKNDTVDVSSVDTVSENNMIDVQSVDNITENSKVDVPTVDGVTESNTVDVLSVDNVTKNNTVDVPTVDGLAESNRVDVPSVENVAESNTVDVPSADDVTESNTVDVQSVDDVTENNIVDVTNVDGVTENNRMCELAVNSAEYQINWADKTNSEAEDAGGDELHQEICYLKANPLPDLPFPTQSRLPTSYSTDGEGLLRTLCTEMRSGNARKAKKIFDQWDKKNNSRKVSITKKVVCPFCGEERSNLKTHTMIVHGLTEENAKALRTQTAQMNYEGKIKPECKRKGKQRHYRKRVCPVTGCAKVVVRLENHLRQTHRVDDQKIYKRLLREASYFEEYKTESDASLTDTTESDEEYFKTAIKKVKKVPVTVSDSSDTSDDDWLQKFRKDREKFFRKNNESTKDVAMTEKLLYTHENIEIDIQADHQAESRSDIDQDHTDFLIEERNTNDDDHVTQTAWFDKEAVSDDEDEDEEDENIEVLLTPWKEATLFESFHSWLISPDGKSKNDRQAKQHIKQVEYILQESSGRSYDLKCLFDRKLLRDCWLLKFELIRKPGTVKSYLHSLRFFFKFVVCDDPVECSSFQGQCNAMIVVMENWISVYRNRVKRSRWEKDLTQLTQLFKGNEIKALDDSEYVSHCKNLFKKVKCESKPPSFKEFISARDYLMMYLCLDNASRTGALANMTLTEFNRGTFENSAFKVAVLEHKTLSTSGPCVIVFTSELYKEAQIFLRQFRNRLDGIDSQPNLFTSWSGKKMSSSMVTAQLNSFWGKAIGHTKERPRISATLVRKSAVSKVHECEPDLKRDLANLMCHSEATAQKTYFLQEKTKKAGKTSALLRGILRAEEEKEGDIDEAIRKYFSEDIKNQKITLTIVREKQDIADELKKYTDIQLRDKIRYIISKTEENDKKVENQEEQFEAASNASEDDVGPSWNRQRKERVTFSSTHIKILQEQFASLIKASPERNINRNAFQSIISRHELKELLKRYGEYTLLLKVRTERRKYLSKLLGRC